VKDCFGESTGDFHEIDACVCEESVVGKRLCLGMSVVDEQERA
jgi:hypothetical protein